MIEEPHAQEFITDRSGPSKEIVLIELHTYQWNKKEIVSIWEYGIVGFCNYQN